MALNFDCNKRKRCLIAASTACLFLFNTTTVQTAFAQQVYKWVDSNGKVQYGEKRNAPKTSQEVNVKPLASTGTSAVSRRIDPIETQKEHERLMRKLTGTQGDIPTFKTAPKSEKWPEFKISMPSQSGQNENILALGEAVLQNCVNLAVKLHNLDYSPEKTSTHDQYLRTCPGVRVECVAYRKSPEKNICEPKAMGTEKSITVFRSQS